MLFLVVGTPWKRPRSSRLCWPECGDGRFGGKSSTKTATLWMRLRNSSGRESSAFSTSLTKYSRFILHRTKAHSLSNRRRPRCRRHLVLRRRPRRLLLRRALLDGGYRQLPNQKGLGRGILTYSAHKT